MSVEDLLNKVQNILKSKKIKFRVAKSRNSIYLNAMFDLTHGHVIRISDHEVPKNRKASDLPDISIIDESDIEQFELFVNKMIARRKAKWKNCMTIRPVRCNL